MLVCSYAYYNSISNSLLTLKTQIIILTINWYSLVKKKKVIFV